MEYLAEDTAPEAITARLLRKASVPAPKVGKSTDVEKTLATGRYLNQDREETPKYEPLPALVPAITGEDLKKIINERPDFTAEAEANRGRRAGARQDIGAGLMMAIHGNDRIARAGGQVLTHALEGAKPLRMNAADIAYEGADGEFVESSAARRAQQIKAMEHQLEEQRKEENTRITAEAKRRDLERQSLRDADNARLGAQKLGPTIVIANAAAEKAGKSGEGTKKLTNTESQSLQTLSNNYKNWTGTMDTFKDEYSSTGPLGKPGSKIEDTLTNEFPWARNLVYNDKEQKAADEKAMWWKQQEFFNTLPERHELFGSALTPPETASWNASTIQPGMDPKQIKKFMQIRKDIMERHGIQAYETALANQSHPMAVKKAMSGFGKVLERGDYEAPTNNLAEAAKAELEKRNPRKR